MGQGKSKFSVNVREAIVELFDEKVAQLRMDRSEGVEQAIEMWLKKKAEEEEEDYFAKYGEKLIEDDRAWVAFSSEAAIQAWNESDC